MTFEEYASKYPLRQHTVKLILTLLAKPQNLLTLKGTLRLHRDYVRKLLNSMEASGLVYVKAWERAGKSNQSPWREVWAAGPGISLPIPRLSEEEKREQDRISARKRAARDRAILKQPRPKNLWHDLLNAVK